MQNTPYLAELSNRLKKFYSGSADFLVNNDELFRKLLVHRRFRMDRWISKETYTHMLSC